MLKNLVYAVTLSLAFLVLWYFFGSRLIVAPPSAPEKRQEQSSSYKEPAGAVAGSAKEEKGKGEKKEKSGVLSARGESLSVPETEKSLDLPGARLVIHSRGASVKHLWLKEKSGTTLPEAFNKNWPDLVNHPGGAGGELLPVESYPLSTYPDLSFKEIPCGNEGKNVFQSCWKTLLPSGVELEKKYIAEGNNEPGAGASHFLKIVLSFRNPTKKAVEVESFKWGLDKGIGTVESEKKENAGLTRVLAYPSPTKEIVKLASSEEKMDYSWVGIDNRYYLFALIPQAGAFDAVRTEKSKTNPGTLHLVPKKILLSPGEIKTLELKIYAGPKGYIQLKKWGLGLEHAVDFGYFGFLGKWALKSMYFIHGVTGNYGWAIVILTCILQVIVFPLSLTSYKSAAAMKRLQPKIQELQKRYKSDPKRMNQEMMTLYKESGTNPFGGCLPMILQIPIFWAFFTMLRNSYELSGAPWIFWIKDLAQYDPYYVLPIVMGGGMFVQQKVTGSVGDPTQAKMMMFMPVIFTFMFLKFPSGLVLYWLTNSILSIAGQYWYKVKAERQNAPRAI